MDTGTLIRVNRALQGRTRKALAEELGVRPLTVWRWETGRTQIPPQQAERVMRALILPAGTRSDSGNEAA
jgi:transcriptional regulator with XRE-family HTH domain